MTRRKSRLNRLLDAIADGRPMPPGRVDDRADVEALRTAIEVRAAVPAADLPSEAFVIKLRGQLADQSAA